MIEAKLLAGIKRAVLIDPGKVASLSPFLDKGSVAMLPFATKPLIQFWLESLASSGVQDVMLLLSHFPEQVRSFVGGGERWGINLSILAVREDATQTQKLFHVKDFIADAALVVYLDTLPARGFSSWFSCNAADWNGGLLHASISVDGFGMETSSSSNLISEGCKEGEQICRKLVTPRDIWQSNMDLLAGELFDDHPAGFETSRGIFVCRNARIDNSSRPHTPSVIGESTMIRERVNIGPQVALGNGVFVDAGCSIRHSVVFDHTFISSHMELDRVIVAGSVLYKVDSGIVVHIDDKLIISSIYNGAEEVTLTQRFVAFILLFLLGFPAALFVLFMKVTGKSVWHRESLEVTAGVSLDGSLESKIIEVTSLAVRNRAWRKLPWLKHVIQGELALTGITPRRINSGEIPEWARDVTTSRPGVITLADVTLLSDLGEDSEDSLIADVYYQATGNGGVDWGLILKWLKMLLIF